MSARYYFEKIAPLTSEELNLVWELDSDRICAMSPDGIHWTEDEDDWIVLCCLCGWHPIMQEHWPWGKPTRHIQPSQPWPDPI